MKKNKRHNIIKTILERAKTTEEAKFCFLLEILETGKLTPTEVKEIFTIYQKKKVA